MKKYIIALLLCVCCKPVLAQLSATLTINQPSATLSEWAINNSTLTYVVDNVTTGGSRQVIIKSVLKTTDGTTVATTDLSKAPLFTIGPGTRIFFAKDVFPMDAMIFSGSYKTTLERTGKLPAGTYQLEVQLVMPSTYAALTGLQMRMFKLTAPQLPYLIMPMNNDSLNAKKAETAITFRWTPFIPRTSEQPYYRLQVFEILPNQQPLQALRGNQPLLDVTVRSITQYIWRPQISFSVDSTNKTFIWTVQTLNQAKQPYVQTDGNGESRSEPFIFWVKGHLQ
jgi:hypothetical protein